MTPSGGLRSRCHKKAAAAAFRREKKAKQFSLLPAYEEPDDDSKKELNLILICKQQFMCLRLENLKKVAPPSFSSSIFRLCRRVVFCIQAHLDTIFVVCHKNFTPGFKVSRQLNISYSSPSCMYCSYLSLKVEVGKHSQVSSPFLPTFILVTISTKKISSGVDKPQSP